MNVLIDIGLYFSYALLGITALAMIIFPIRYMIKHPAEAKYPMISIGVVIGIFLVGFLLSSSDVPAMFTKYEIGNSQFKLVGGGLIMVYILTITAIGVLLYGEIKGLFK